MRCIKIRIVLPAFFVFAVFPFSSVGASALTVSYPEDNASISTGASKSFFAESYAGGCDSPDSNTSVVISLSNQVDVNGQLTDPTPMVIPMYGSYLGSPYCEASAGPFDTPGDRYWQIKSTDCPDGTGPNLECWTPIRKLIVFQPGPYQISTTYAGTGTIIWNSNPYQPHQGRNGTQETVAPAITSLKITGKFTHSSKKTVARATVSKKKIKKGATISYTLSEAATVWLVMKKETKGLKLKQKGKKKKKRCVSNTKKNKRKLKNQIKSNHKKKKLSKKKLRSEIRKASCTLYKNKGALARSGTKGKNTVPFSGRIGKRKLARGNYRLVATARDVAGNVSKPKRKSFKIVKAKNKKAKK